MVMLNKKAGIIVNPPNPGNTISGVMAISVAPNDNPYPSSTITPSTASMIAISKSVPDPTLTALNALLNLTRVVKNKVCPACPDNPVIGVSASNDPVPPGSNSTIPNNLSVTPSHS